MALIAVLSNRLHQLFIGFQTLFCLFFRGILGLLSSLRGGSAAFFVRNAIFPEDLELGLGELLCSLLRSACFPGNFGTPFGS